MGERKTASIRRLRKGETSRGPREQRPAACKKQAAESNNEVTSNFPWTATLEAKRAGWERDWASDHLEPFWWVVAGASTTCSLAGCLYARAGRRQCGYERACVFAYCIGRIPPLYPRERSPVHLHTLGLGACLAGPHCRCCHRLFVVRRVPFRGQVATEGMKSWHGCRLSSSARGPCEPLRVPCTSVILRGCREGELVPAARAAAPCDVRARPFACAAEMQLAIPE